MSEINRAALFGKLNSLAYKAIEGATVFCKLRGNPYVELVHWIQQILQTPESDMHRIVKHFELDPSRLAKDVTDALDRLPRGATSISDLSSHVENAVERGWVYATLMFGDSQVRTGLPDGRHGQDAVAAQRALGDLEAVRADQARHADRRSRRRSSRARAEDALSATDGSSMAAPGEASGAMAPAQMGKQEALKKYATDLTDRARKGQIDPITGRDEEIRQIVDILMRRRQNNPILTGEAGVGKTAVVEGFALRLARGDVPPPLQDVSLLTLDIGLLQAGASMKGEFENRLRQVIDEVQASPKPIILFIDEAHTLIGAGGAAGTGDAANLLKPALARGTLRTIAATTWAEYKKHIEKDPALTRRFQVVQVARAGRGESHPHAARRRVGAREAPSRPGPGRGARGRRAPLASLHPGAAVARQGRQPAGHHVRAGGDQPARRAGAARRLPADDRVAADRARDHRARRSGRHERRRAQADCEREAGGGRRAARSSSRSGGRASATLVDRILAIRATLQERQRAGRRHRQRSRSSAAQAQKAGGRRCGGGRSAREPSLPTDREQLLAELAGLQATARRAAGRVAADPAQRGRAGCRRRSCRTGPACPLAAWSRTRSRRCSSSPRR